MKKALFIFLIPIFCPNLLTQPSIYVEKTNIDLGITLENSDVFHEIKLENRGSEDLIIYNIQSTCRCTVLDFPKIIPPGKEGILKIVIEPKTRRGKWYVALRIDSNDPETPNLPIKLNLTVLPLFEFYILEGENLVFPEDDLKNLKIKIYSKHLDSFTIYNINVIPETIVPMATPDFFTEVKGSEGYLVELHFSAPLPKGKNIIELNLATSNQDLPKVTYSFPITIKEYISVEPQTLSFHLKGNPSTLTSLKEEAPLYAYPSLESKTNFKIKRGPAYKILGYKNDFFLIEYSKNQKFWIYNEDIQILDANYNALATVTSINNIKFQITKIEAPEGFRYLIDKKTDSEYLIFFWFQKMEPFKVNGLIINLETDFPKAKELKIYLKDFEEGKINQINPSKKLSRPPR